MNMKRCENGHFFDGDKFVSCPHCAVIGGDGNATVPYADMGNAYGGVEMTDPVTMPMRHAAPQPVPMPMPAQPPMEPGPMTLKEAVNQAAAISSELPDEEKTVSIYQAKKGIDPVAGWLVCVEGQDFGGSFTIKSGRNFIGRSSGMDISLRGDNSISREKHAIILYEPKRREFIAQAGESRELFYLNEEVVLNPVKLKRGDILTIGNTQLMFFPCCGEDFSWDDFKKEEG